MPTEFLMPKLGLTMEEGTIVEWLVPDGAAVTAGTAVMLIETDKVETEVEAVIDGQIHRTAAAGETFPCGAVIAWIVAEGEAPPVSSPSVPAATPAGATGPTVARIAAGAGVAHAGSSNGRRFVSPNARRVAAELGVDVSRVTGSGPGGRVVSEDVEEAAARGDVAPAAADSATPAARPVPASPSSTTGSYPATAAARQLADLLGVDLAEVEVDPVDRYVTRETVAKYVRERLRTPAASPSSASTGAAAPSAAMSPLQTPTAVRRMSPMRKTIARRTHSSLQEMAQLTLTMDADVDAVVADRERRRADGSAPGFTDYVLAASAHALREHPIVNAQLTPDGIALLPDVHVGLAVALDEGLVVPVVRHADRLTLGDLATETSRLAGAARAGSLSMADLEGGTFSVSALGMFGVDAFTPVINPPNVAILGVGRIRDDIVLVDGAVGTTKRLTLSLTWDHRVLDGAPAAAFCRTIVEFLADPGRLEGP